MMELIDSGLHPSVEESVGFGALGTDGGDET
jgi:hypothetical protein